MHLMILLSENDAIEIDEDMTNGRKKVMPRLLSNAEKREFNDQYLPALVEMCRWILSIQFRDIMLLDSSVLFKAIWESQKLVAILLSLKTIWTQTIPL